MLILLLLLCAVTAAAQDFEGYVQSWVRDGRFRGAVLVARNGEPVFRKAYGKANEEWDIANTPETKFRLGSITKQFTAACVMQLVEQNKLTLDDPISKYYPDAPPAWAKINVRHLLNHTSGIPSYTGLPGFMQKRVRERMTPVEIVKLTQDMPLEFEPGSKFAYDNTGYILLGYLIDKLSGLSYADYVQRHIFDRLDMKDSGYDTAEAVIKRRASGYSPNGTNSPFIDMSLPYAAGSLYSTVDDLVKWDKGLYGGKVVKAESLAAMTSPGLSDYGFGLVIRNENGRKMIGHGGGINGFNTEMTRFPEQGVVAIVLSNQNTGATGQIAIGLARLAMGDDVKPRPLRTEIKLPAEKLDQLAGEYELRPGFSMKVWRDGERMMTQATGQGPAEIFAISDTRFFVKVVDAELEFERGSDGRATAMTLHQGGREIRAPKK